MTKLNDNQRLLFGYFNEIGIIAQLSSRMFEQRLPDGLTPSQFSVLNWFLRVDDEATPGRLAKAFQVTGGAMTNTLKKLEAKGLIRIEPDQTSGRKKKVTLTEAGREAREACLEAIAPLLDECSETFSIKAIESQMKPLADVRRYLDDYRYQNRPGNQTDV